MRADRGAWRAPVLWLLVMLAAACSGPPEEPMLRRYFRAALLGDNQTLADFALVTLNPRSDGAVTSFEITSVAAERIEPLRVSEWSNPRPAVELSLAGGEPPDRATAEGELISKDVSVNATMSMPDGSTTEKPLVVTMQRARLKTPSGEQLGRWVLTAVRPA